MMEKYGNSETRVWRENDKLMMQLPGGDTILPYDERFGNLDALPEGVDRFFPVLKD